MSEPTATPGASRRHFLTTLCIAAPGLVTISPALARHGHARANAGASLSASRGATAGRTVDRTANADANATTSTSESQSANQQANGREPGTRAATEPATAAGRQPADDAWESLFDGRTLGKWTPTEFGGEGDVTVEDGRILLATGNDLTGITWNGGKLPTADYEIALRAMRLSGADFFCGLTFPVQTSFCSFIAGGWTGTIVGLSTVDGRDASANETKVLRVLDDNRWYAIRVRVTADRIEAWIDDARIVSLPIAGRKLSVRPEVADSRPLGIASYRTRAALDDIRLRRL